VSQIEGARPPSPAVALPALAAVLGSAPIPLRRSRMTITFGLSLVLDEALVHVVAELQRHHR
jgi:hypothetical protein